jgi:hypothetical protein
MQLEGRSALPTFEDPDPARITRIRTQSIGKAARRPPSPRHALFTYLQKPLALRGLDIEPARHHNDHQLTPLPTPMILPPFAGHFGRPSAEVQASGSLGIIGTRNFGLDAEASP